VGKDQLLLTIIKKENLFIEKNVIIVQEKEKMEFPIGANLDIRKNRVATSADLHQNIKNNLVCTI
jgi:hypothetical protein